jgi:hypothetical protein
MFTCLLAAAALSQPLFANDCDAECERRGGAALIERGDTRAAVERLRIAVTRFPDDRVLPLLLARSYLGEGNLFWAERTLREALVRHPSDVEARAWLALVHLRQGDPELVRADLELGLIPEDGQPGRAGSSCSPSVRVSPGTAKPPTKLCSRCRGARGSTRRTDRCGASFSGRATRGGSIP